MTSTLDRRAVLDAAERIQGAVVETPLLPVEDDGVRFHLKLESMQTGGAFKLRGASNRLLAMSEEERARGVVAFSSGNHAQGVAIAAARLGMPATIVMPSDAPKTKVEGTRAQGAEIIFYDRMTESREEIAARIAADSGAIVVPSFDDHHIVAGQGTVGLEILRQLGRAPSRIAIPCGGGGLSAGIALACPDSEVHFVEPAGWDDMARSMDGGAMQRVPKDAPTTLCDALQTPMAATRTRDILKQAGAKAHQATDEEIIAAMRWLKSAHNLVAEPGGVAALAAVMAGKFPLDEHLVVVISGGNVDPALYAQLVP